MLGCRSGFTWQFLLVWRFVGSTVLSSAAWLLSWAPYFASGLNLWELVQWEGRLHAGFGLLRASVASQVKGEAFQSGKEADVAHCFGCACPAISRWGEVQEYGSQPQLPLLLFPPLTGSEAVQHSDPFFISRAPPLAQWCRAVTRCHPPFVPIFEEPTLCLLGELCFWMFLFCALWVIFPSFLYLTIFSHCHSDCLRGKHSWVTSGFYWTQIAYQTGPLLQFVLHQAGCTNQILHFIFRES